MKPHNRTWTPSPTELLESKVKQLTAMNDKLIKGLAEKSGEVVILEENLRRLADKFNATKVSLRDWVEHGKSQDKQIAKLKAENRYYKIAAIGSLLTTAILIYIKVICN